MSGYPIFAELEKERKPQKGNLQPQDHCFRIPFWCSLGTKWSPKPHDESQAGTQGSMDGALMGIGWIKAAPSSLCSTCSKASVVSITWSVRTLVTSVPTTSRSHFLRPCSRLLTVRCPHSHLGAAEGLWWEGKDCPRLMLASPRLQRERGHPGVPICRGPAGAKGQCQAPRPPPSAATSV